MTKHYNPLDKPDESTTGDGLEGADFQVEAVVKETDRAIRVVMRDTGKYMWIPKSVIHVDSEVYERPLDGTDGAGTLIVQMWFAEKEGLL